MSETVTIRAARREDVPEILVIYNAAVREPAAAYEDSPNTLRQREEWFEYYYQRNFPILVSERAGLVVGWGSLGPHQERSGFRFTGSVALYVDAIYRRQGIGGLLLEGLLETARERRLHCLLAVIDSKNEPSLKLHQRLGFRTAGTFRQAGCKFGQWRDVVYLQYLLDDRSSPGD